MLISLRHNFVFLCNRKCASISVETMLRKYCDVSIAGPPDLRHSNYRLYRRHLAPYLHAAVGARQLETICLVREPVSWLYSWYRFRSRLALRNPGGADDRRSTAGIGFTRFVRASMQPDPPAYADVGSQFDFVRTTDGDIGVDRIFVYERIDELVDFMSRRIGRSLRIGHKNMSPRKNRNTYVTSLVDRMVKTAVSQFNIPKGAETATPPPLPADVLAALARAMSEDFALYEQATRQRGQRASA